MTKGLKRETCWEEWFGLLFERFDANLFLFDSSTNISKNRWLIFYFKIFRGQLQHNIESHGFEGINIEQIMEFIYN